MHFGKIELLTSFVMQENIIELFQYRIDKKISIGLFSTIDHSLLWAKLASIITK